MASWESVSLISNRNTHLFWSMHCLISSHNQFPAVRRTLWWRQESEMCLLGALMKTDSVE
jgi:hypothetical protein